MYLEGRMTSRRYTDKDGNERTAWEVTATDMEMLESRAESQARMGQGGRSEFGDEDMSTDDIPF